jgi:hypothetical protein
MFRFVTLVIGGLFIWYVFDTPGTQPAEAFLGGAMFTFGLTGLIRGGA